MGLLKCHRLAFLGSWVAKGADGDVEEWREGDSGEPRICLCAQFRSWLYFTLNLQGFEPETPRKLSSKCICMVF